MFPLFLERIPDDLEASMTEVIRLSSALGARLNPWLRSELAELMLQINSYYTNAMEGNPSKLKDIEAALNRQLSKNPSLRNAQLEHLAHISVQREMRARLQADPSLNICSQEFLCWLHERFYAQLPEAYRQAKTLSEKIIPIEPGRLRERGAVVGTHHAPENSREIESCLDDFATLLNPSRVPASRQIMAMATSHHRFLWIHPFPDGNGRVARLFTAAYAARIGVDAHGLWSVSRAFARQRADYDSALAMADRLRRNDYDGRGPLSTEDLESFVRFFVDCCNDQLRFISGLVEPEALTDRLNALLQIRMTDRKATLSKNAAKLIRTVFKEGEIRRGDTQEICGVEARQANKLTKEALSSGLLQSPSPKGPLRFRINQDTARVLFPDLA